MLRFVCEHCKESVRVKEAFTGRKGRCPHCGQIVQIPGRLLGDGEDNVSALAAALGRDDELADTATVPPPPTTAKPDIDEFDLVDIEAAADLETDCYPAIRPKGDAGEPPPEPPGSLPLPTEPLPTSKITWQNILLILVALMVVGAIGAMIVWTHFY